MYTNGTAFGINGTSLNNRSRSSHHEKEQISRNAIRFGFPPRTAFLGFPAHELIAKAKPLSKK
jgi:hypothetical protein